MTHVITEPQIIAAAATDVAGIRSAISEANAAAAGPITDLVAAAADEVSAAAAAFFSTYAQEFRAVLSQVASLHGHFAQALAAAGSAYAEAEAANTAAAMSGALSALTAPVQSAVTTTALIMGGSDMPIPDQTYLSNVVAKYIAPKFSDPTLNAQALFTPEGLYPIFGPKDLTLDVSVARGVTILDNAIQQQLATGNHVTVLGLSQSSVISSLEMTNLDPTGVPSSLPISFTLLGDPMNPNGGLLERFAGLTLPSLGITAYGATPANSFPTDIYTVEYDGYADFPRYPINALSDLNALAGIVYLHDTYPDLTPAQLASAITLPTQGPTQTTYQLIPTQNLPLLEPLRALPLVGNPIADLIQPDLKVLVNLGYGDPGYGYSTAPANVPTPLGLFPHVSQQLIAQDLITGAHQGATAFVSDIQAEASGFSLSSLSHSLTSMAPTGGAGLTALRSALTSALSTGISPDGIIAAIQTVNTDIATGISNAVANAYGILLPTADIANALLISMPSYDLNLFLNGISQVAHGNPMGLINAIGYPIAADTGLVLVAGGWELIVIVNGIVLGLGGQLSG